MSPRVFRWCALALAAVAWIARAIALDPKVVFFTPGPGKWIVYPSRRSIHVVNQMALPAAFRRSFTLSSVPRAAELSWRCYREGDVRINGAIVSENTGGRNWKHVIRLDVAKYLRQGTNQIETDVAAAFGPPALTLELAAGDFVLTSDEQWQVTEGGALWREAREAAKVPRARPGNEIYAVETTAEGFQRCWPLLLALAIGSAAVAPLLLWRKTAAVLLIVLGIGWIALFVHNCNLLPLDTGFDGADHMTYVRFLLEHKSAPSPNQGFEMFQPPLYHACVALVLGLCRLTTDTMSGMIAMRLFNTVIGAATVALILAGLRLLFPGQLKKQFFGVVIGAFCPMFLCLLHYPTNEILAAMLVTAALYTCLRILRQPGLAPASCAALGAILGAAMLAKASATVALVLIIAVLAVKLIADSERSPIVWLTTVGLAVEVCAAICGWHYWNMWHHFGNPLTGNWDTSIAVPWWQYPGYHTWSHYLSFGAALRQPFFSSFESVGDSLYSTMWGDGLCAGAAELFQRPPWNYHLMAVGFVLALAPAVVILTGFIRAAVECLKNPRLEWVLVTGVAVSYALAVVYMTLKLPFYSQAKSFYGLTVLLSMSVFAVLGFDWLTGSSRFRQCILLTVLGLWLAVDYGSFWIRPGLAADLARAAGEFNFGNPAQAAADFSAVLAADPNNTFATAFLAEADSRRNRNDLAAQRVEDFLQRHPSDAYVESRGAPYAAVESKLPLALDWASNATLAAPGDPIPSQVWCALAVKSGDYATAVHAARVALALNPYLPSTHLHLGIALLRLGKTNEAAAQFNFAASGYPPAPDAQRWLEQLRR